MKTFTKAELIEHLQTSDKVVLMHGTPSHPFETFNTRSITRAHDGNLLVNNNEFGIHLTGCPFTAQDYATRPNELPSDAPVGSIMIVEADISRMHRESDRDEYLELTEEQYAIWRMQLLDEDIDGVVADELGNDLDLCCVVLDHSKVRIIGSIPANLSDVDLDEIARARPTQPGRSLIRSWLPGVEIEEIEGPWAEDRWARMEQDSDYSAAY